MNTERNILLIFLIILIILFIIWDIHRQRQRQSQVENFSDTEYNDDNYQSVTKTYIKGIKYKRNINLVLHPNELFKTVNLPYLFPEFVKLKDIPHNHLSYEVITPNSVSLINDDILNNLPTISSQNSVQKYYNLPIINNPFTKIATICNNDFVYYTLITLSKHNSIKYSDIFNEKIGVFGSQGIWSLFFIYQIYNKTFDLSNIILYENENKIKKDYIDKKIKYIFTVNNHPNRLCYDIFKSTQSVIIDIKNDPDISLEKIHFFISENVKIKEIELQDYNFGNIKVEAISIKSTFITHANSNKKLIYLFTKHFYDSIPYYKYYIKSMSEVYKWSLLPQSVNLNIHPGSKQFFLEKGFIMMENEDDPNKINYILESKYGY